MRGRPGRRRRGGNGRAKGRAAEYAEVVPAVESHVGGRRLARRGGGGEGRAGRPRHSGEHPFGGQPCGPGSATRVFTARRRTGVSAGAERASYNRRRLGSSRAGPGAGRRPRGPGSPRPAAPTCPRTHPGQRAETSGRPPRLPGRCHPSSPGRGGTESGQETGRPAPPIFKQPVPHS